MGGVRSKTIMTKVGSGFSCRSTRSIPAQRVFKLQCKRYGDVFANLLPSL